MSPVPRREVLAGLSTLPAAGVVDADVVGARKSGVAPWPRFQYDRARTGYTDALSAPGPQLEERWSVDLGGGGGDPTVTTGNVYAGSYVLEAETGRGLWRGGGFYHRGALYASASVDGRNGIEKLNPATGEVTESFPLAGDLDTDEGIDQLFAVGDVMVVSTNRPGAREYGDVRAISLSTHELLWHFDDNRDVPMMASKDGSLYVWQDIDNRFYSLNVQTGEVEWQRRVYNAYSPPAVADGNVYVPTDSRLHAFGTSLGTQRWEYDRGELTGSPAAGGGRVFCPIGTHVVCLDSRGNEQWTFSPEGDWEPYFGSPIVVDGTVYVGDYEEHLHLLDAETGEELNRFRPESGVTTVPAVANDTVYFGTAEGRLFALANDPNEPPRASFSYTPERPTVDSTVTFDASGSSDDVGVEKYRWDLDGDGEFERRGQITPNAFESSGEYEVTLQTVDGGGKSDEVTKSVAVASSDSVPTAAFTTSSNVIVVDESVAFDAGTASDADGQLERYEWTVDGETATGETVSWTFESTGEHSVTLRVTDDEGLTDTVERTVIVRSRRASFSVTRGDAELPAGGRTAVTLSAVNYLSEHSLTVQVAVGTPEGVSVASVRGGERGEEYTAVAELAGASRTDVEMELEVTEPGTHDVDVRAVYYVGESADETFEFSETVSVTAVESTTGASSRETEAGGQDAAGDGDDGEATEALETGDSPGMGVLAGAAGVLGSLGALAAREGDDESS